MCQCVLRTAGSRHSTTVVVLTGVGRVAVAVVVVDVVEAGAAVPAGLRRALVDVERAVVARVPRARALAREAVQSVHAAPAVLAWRRLHTNVIT